mgnify:FL=1
MIVKEIRVLENVNVPFLANMLEELKKIGCEINEENGTLKLKYDDNLESKVAELLSKITSCQ